MQKTSPGKTFRQAIATEQPLQIVGVVNAYIAIMAKSVGFNALYLSGAGVANVSYGLPDLGFTTLDNVLEDVRRITGAVDLPLLVDIDTGWDSPENTVQEMIKAGAAAVHIEDQVPQKRCGHRPGKELVSTQEMCDRIKSAISGKEDPDFLVMARTDALANEGLNKTLDRARAYEEAGAEAIFAEACTTLEEYRAFKQALEIPILANLTELGKTPLFPLHDLQKANVNMVLYPLSANRAQCKAALHVLSTIRKTGSQASVVDTMQTRDELYEFLSYYDLEKRQNQAIAINDKIK